MHYTNFVNISVSNVKPKLLRVIIIAYIIGVIFFTYRLFTHIPNHSILLSIITFLCMFYNFIGPFNDLTGTVLESELPYSLGILINTELFDKRLLDIKIKMIVLLVFIILANILL